MPITNDELLVNNDKWTCPSCGNDDLVLPAGPRTAKILVIGEFPGEEEIRAGRPFVGPMGAVFLRETRRAGLDMRKARITNLWLHAPNRNKECFEFGVSRAIEEARGKKAILLLGSETVKFFVDANVTEVMGLAVKSNYFSAPIVFACQNPAIVFHQPIGEIRLALNKFAILLEKERIK